ncbi:MAG: DUF4838 domain-containing protein [Bryobacterales bacterium]|nr:DUF4838 domain-containing protein [Bryobacterales bacterium]
MKNVLAVFFAASLCYAAPGAIQLVSGGKSTYSICLSRQASPSERRGAEEFQRFIEEISGARLPVVTEGAARGNLVLIGRSAALDRLKPGIPFEQLGPEGFALKTAGRNLIIAGGRQRGTMYGVYTLLEKLGCRWFAPGASRIPRMATIAIGPLDETGKPAFEYREPFFTEAFDKDWAARNKTNGDHSNLDESTGGKVQYYPFVHSFYQMIPPEKHFKEHPEYFSLIDGQRRVERGQLCLTNPEVLRLGIEAVRTWIREHPRATIYSVSQNDWEGWCECDNCRRVEQEEGGVHSGPVLRYVNALAAAIEKEHPDKLIDTLAYWYTEDPPAKARPRPNVRIRLCPIGACEAHPYEKCERNAYFMRNLRAWSKITNQLYIWHYNTNFSHYLIPFPDFDELAADIPMYKRHGVVGLFMQGAYAKNGGGENAELRSYVMAKLLWDTGADAERAINEFHEGYYGPAAKAMRAYFDLLHDQVRGGQHIWIFNVPAYSPEFLRRAGELFDEAERAAGSGVERERVRKARLSLDYVHLLNARRFEVRGDWYEPASLLELRARFEGFLKSVRGFGITSIHEGRNLDWDESEFRRYMKPYRVHRQENAALRAEVAPELSGRVVRLSGKGSGAELLRSLETGERGYPDVGGLAAFVYPDFHGRAWDVRWTGGPGGELTGTTANGLELRRRLMLEGATLRTVTTVTNRSSERLEVALQSRGEFRAADLRIQPGELSAGNDPCTVSGRWRVTGQVVAEAPPEQLDRCSINWSAKGEGRVTLTLWSKKRILAPGESLELQAAYTAEPGRWNRAAGRFGPLTGMQSRVF